MSNFSKEHISELTRIFLGELQQPQTSWILPVNEPFIDIRGESVSQGNDMFLLDFGSVSAMETAHRSVFISNLTQVTLMLGLEEENGCISAQFEKECSEIILGGGGEAARLNLFFNSNSIEEKPVKETIRILAEMDSGSRKKFDLQVTVQPVVAFPYVELDFNGSKHPVPHDFGIIDPTQEDPGSFETCQLYIKNVGKKNLIFSFEEVPLWLNIEADEQVVRKQGNQFNIAPDMKTYIIMFNPLPSMDFFGPRQCKVQLITNDIRPALQNINLEFSVTQEIEGAYVTLAEEPHVEVVPGGLREFKIQLLNWGKAVAKLCREKIPDIIKVEEDIRIPMACDGKPGKLDVTAAITGEKLKPGDHRLEMEFSIPDSKLEQLAIPVKVHVVGIIANPKELDFGAVEPGENRMETVDFKATDERELNISAKPVPKLKNYLTVKVVNSDSLEVNCFIQTDKTDSLSEFEGPGIDVKDPGMDYRLALPVKFHLAKPEIVIEPQIIKGNAFKGIKIGKSFEVFNKGDGKLEIETVPEIESIEIVNDEKFIIEPGGSKIVHFKAGVDNISTPSLQTAIDLLTNIPTKGKYKVNVDLEIKPLAGKICSRCKMVSKMEFPFCSFCGNNLEKEQPVSGDMVHFCPACNRKFEKVLKYCPVDGNELKGGAA